MNNKGLKTKIQRNKLWFIPVQRWNIKVVNDAFV